MTQIKVFHGVSEVAGQAHYSVKGLRECGVETTHVVWTPSLFQYDYDVSLGIDKKRKYLLPLWAWRVLRCEIKMLRKCNVFHFHYGRSLLLNFDLRLMKMLGKKIFFEFHGSDLRDYRYANERNKYVWVEENDSGNEKRKKRAAKICKYADGIILHDDELIPHLPDNAKTVYVVPLRVDLSKIAPAKITEERETIKVVHAPTHREIKGSEYVIKAVKALQSKYPVEMILVEGKTQEEALQLYREADVIVDQLRIGTYGVFAIEGMAMGKPVVTYVTDEMRECLPEDLPVCSANPDTIEAVLETLLSDGSLRRELGNRGRKYVEKYHDYAKNAKMLLDIYSGRIAPMRGREAFSYAAGVSDGGVKE